MTRYKPVSVSKGGFAFCRLGLTALVWLSLILHSKPLLLFVFVMLLLSAILKVQRAPMIVLYDQTIGRIRKSNEVILNESAMRFAHATGTIFSLVCLALLWLADERMGWAGVFLFAVLKSVSALGYCPASKLYECATGGSCCTILKKR
ncbi:MAG: DUF4395 family protein [Chlorobiales bacterium]|nr:DUF4395 family protein [Chlorobiales bacterium]